MKVSVLIKNLQKLKKQYGDIEVITSSDDEGNSYSPIHYAATPGNFDDDYNFITQDMVNPDEQISVNAICVN